MSDITYAGVMPVLALRGLAVFPEQTVHFDVGRKKSIAALERAMMEDQRIFLVAQRDIDVDDPGIDDIYHVGTVCRVRQQLRQPHSSCRVMVEGLYRAEAISMDTEGKVYSA